MHEQAPEPSSVDPSKPPEGKEPGRQRRPYVPPELVEYGTVAALTEGVRTRNPEHLGGFSIGHHR